MAQPRPAAATETPARSGFQPVRSGEPVAGRVHAKAIVLGALFGLIFGASTVYLGPARRPDGQRLDPDRRARDLGAQAPRRLDHPREQHRADDRVGRRIGRRRRRLHGSRADLPRRRAGQAFFNYFQIMMLALAGGILGVLMMVPLRRALIVKEHGVLPYPEGTACADVLIAGERGGELATTVFRASASARCGRALSWIFQIFRTVDRLLDRPHQRLTRTPRSTSTSRPSTWASATSSARASPASCSPAACCRGWCCCRCSASSGNYMTVPLPARAGERPAHRSDVARPAVERLHPLHRRRRRARRRAHHAGPDDPDDRLVVPRQREGLLRAGSGAAARAAHRARHAADGRARRHARCWRIFLAVAPQHADAGQLRSRRSWSSSSASSSSPCRRASSG